MYASTASRGCGPVDIEGVFIFASTTDLIIVLTRAVSERIVLPTLSVNGMMSERRVRGRTNQRYSCVGGTMSPK
jgi:hypothetical protein